MSDKTLPVPPPEQQVGIVVESVDEIAGSWEGSLENVATLIDDMVHFAHTTHSMHGWAVNNPQYPGLADDPFALSPKRLILGRCGRISLQMRQEWPVLAGLARYITETLLPEANPHRYEMLGNSGLTINLFRPCRLHLTKVRHLSRLPLAWFKMEKCVYYAVSIDVVSGRSDGAAPLFSARASQKTNVFLPAPRSSRRNVGAIMVKEMGGEPPSAVCSCLSRRARRCQFDVARHPDCGRPEVFEFPEPTYDEWDQVTDSEQSQMERENREDHYVEAVTHRQQSEQEDGRLPEEETAEDRVRWNRLLDHEEVDVLADDLQSDLGVTARPRKRMASPAESDVGRDIETNLSNLVKSDSEEEEEEEDEERGQQH